MPNAVLSTEIMAKALSLCSLQWGETESWRNDYAMLCMRGEQAMNRLERAEWDPRASQLPNTPSSATLGWRWTFNLNFTGVPPEAQRG